MKAALRNLDRSFRRDARWWSFFMLAGGCSVSLGAGVIDESKLPPATTNKIDFARDIHPIFEASCFRCHGPERPKSRFRLDNRDAALRGGADNQEDIIPGQSAKSPLIHYVARLVEDMEMPPKGKGDALTPEQIGRLRAWIDQGAAWGQATPPEKTEVTLAPIVGGTVLSGNEKEFRAQNWRHEGWDGGVENFEMKDRVGERTKLLVQGHALRDDYKITLALDRDEAGFVHAGAEQYRKYFSDAGGYYQPFTPSIYALDRDLHVDHGRAWIDLGLTLPHWPRLTVGYEYQYQDGTKSALQWGPVTQGQESGVILPTDRTRSIYPAYKDISERIHILKFDFEDEFGGVRLEDSFRGEFYNLGTQRVNETAFNFNTGDTAPSSFYQINEGEKHFQAVNTVRLERQFTGWLFGSAGYLFSHLDADASFDSFDIATATGPVPQWQSQSITLERVSHLFNLNALLGPWDGLTFSAGVQSEWSRQDGFTAATVGAIPVNIQSDLDKTSVEEKVALRYVKIPFTVLFAEARLQQQSIGQFEDEEIVGGGQVFERDTDASSQLVDARIGFNTSPWRRISLNAHYRFYDNTSRYNNPVDEAFGLPGEGYSAFIRRREIESNEGEAKLVVRPATWLNTTFGYKIVDTDYTTSTDPVTGFDPNLGVFVPGYISPGGGLLAGNYKAQIYSLNATFTPWRRLYLTTTFSYQDSRTATFANGDPSVVPYRGHVGSVLASANFVLNDKTDLQASYAFSHADYTQNNEASGLPLGIDYDRHWVQAGIVRRVMKDLTVRLQYSFYFYNEPSSGHFTDYTAQAVFATVNLRLH